MEVVKLFLVWFSKYNRKLRIKLLTSYLAELRVIRSRFGKASVRYVDNINHLLTLVTGLRLKQTEDYNYLKTLTLEVNTLSCGKALDVTEFYLGDGYDNSPKGKFSLVGSREVNYLDWYGNVEMNLDFLDDMRTLVFKYVVFNKPESLDHVMGDKDVSLDPHLLDFLNSVEFKLLVSDYISLLELIIEVELDILN